MPQQLLDRATVNRIAEEAALREMPTVVQDLVDLLGGPSVAVLGGVKQTRMVGSWIRDGVQPRPDAEIRLRLAERVAAILRSRFSDKSVRAWFFGANHWLDDEIPLAVIATGDQAEAARNVLGAARAAIGI